MGKDWARARTSMNHMWHTVFIRNIFISKCSYNDILSIFNRLFGLFFSLSLGCCWCCCRCTICLLTCFFLFLYSFVIFKQHDKKWRLMLCVCANCACVNISQTTEMYPHRSEFDVTVLEHSAVVHFRIDIALSDSVQMDTDYL